MSRLSAEIVARVSGEVARYISAQRDRFFSHAEPMGLGAKTALQGFFGRRCWNRRGFWFWVERGLRTRIPM